MAKRGKIIKRTPSREIDERPIKWRKYAHLFLIVCEDEKTEKYYFDTFKNFFPAETLFLRTVGTGKSSKGVVEQSVIERNGLYEESNKKIDEVWAVFDKDDADKTKGNKQRFIEAFEIANKEQINVAYSNEVFELWLLLHFSDVSSEMPIPRADIYTNLEKNIKRIPKHNSFAYKHGNKDIIDIVLISGNENQAIVRADRLNFEHKSKKNQPIDANPNTRVNVLVKKLRELIDWYS